MLHRYTVFYCSILLIVLYYRYAVYCYTPTVALDQWGRRKSYGFVRLSNYAERIRCVEQMNGQVLLQLGLRALTVKPAANDNMLSCYPKYAFQR